MPHWKQKISFVKRGAQGILQNLLEKAPPPPATAKKFSIGSSIQGRDITGYTIGSGPQKILITACIHGNETGTEKLALHILNWLHQKKQYHNKYTTYIIPCLNPDGREQARKHPDYWNGGRIGRCNANNIDLNRNFPSADFQKESIWSHGKNYSQTTKVLCGEKPGSEPETQAITQFILKENIQLWYSLHNAGKDVATSNDPIATDIGHQIAESVGFKLFSEEEWATLKQTGTVKKWCEENNILYIETESVTRWGSDWKYLKKGVETLFKVLSE